MSFIRICVLRFDVSKRCYIVPVKVENLLVKVWDKGVCPMGPNRPTIEDSRNYAKKVLYKNVIAHRQKIVRTFCRPVGIRNRVMWPLARRGSLHFTSC